jgi:hypothetical protein
MVQRNDPESVTCLSSPFFSHMEAITEPLAFDDGHRGDQFDPEVGRVQPVEGDNDRGSEVVLAVELPDADPVP